MLLEAKQLTHSYSSPLFEGVSLQLQPSETIAIVGVSGSGKSTLLNILAGFITPKNGSVSHFGVDFQNRDRKSKEEFRKRDIGVIFQSHYLFRGFTALENIEVASIISGKQVDREILERLGIGSVLNQKVAQLSGGQQQRVSIARVLMKQPKIIFADEPTGNLDNTNSYQVMKTIFEYIEEKRGGLVLVTHDMDLAKKCNRVFRLEHGKFSEI
ncbi:MAG TPA: ABC transporter ATP-binding protein [Campylobacterales bacterium]|nr:ABC transporter ATP-binding protein [Campylobacterales bacterium]